MGHPKMSLSQLRLCLGHGFVGVGTSDGRVGPSSPRTSWRHGAGCFCRERARQGRLGEKLPGQLGVNNAAKPLGVMYGLESY